MAWIMFDGILTEVEIIKVKKVVTELYAKDKSGSFSIPVLEESIYETLEDYDNKISMIALKQKKNTGKNTITTNGRMKN